MCIRAPSFPFLQLHSCSSQSNHPTFAKSNHPTFIKSINIHLQHNPRLLSLKRMRTTLLISALAGLAAAAPHPQKIDFDEVLVS